jgi:hypothetical protein
MSLAASACSCFTGTEGACERGSPGGHGWPAEWARKEPR